MPAYVDLFNKFLALGTIGLHFVLIFILFLLFWNLRNPHYIVLWINKYVLEICFLLGLSAIATSLFYSEVIGFPPCELCWIQRFIIYPQALLFGILIFFRGFSRNRILNASLIISVFGVIVSAYHIFIENGGQSSLPCALPGTANVSCATRYVYEFGYVSIPVMAFTISATILILLLINRHIERGNIFRF